MSVEIPRALQPWAEPLALFGDVVHDGLGRWLHPLRALLGPLTTPAAATSGDPDGYSGLSRRGSYDRLLLSEWALALEAPDEFLRRAATGEHVFMAPAFREPKGRSACVALLDCGPWQLGGPRLAHLAALVVLQQRAEEGGASFQFGVLQDTERKLQALDSVSVPRWLAARTTSTAPEHADDWTTALQPLDPPDRWLVGGPDLRDAATRLRAGLLEIEECIGPEGRVLRIRARRPGQAGGQVELPLPDADTCVRILRAPLAPKRRRRHRLDSTLGGKGTGQLSIDGRRWLLPRADGGVTALHIPNTPAETPGYPKQVPPFPGSTVIAADIKGKRPIALAVQDDGALVLRGSGLMLSGQGPSRSLGEPRALDLPAPESMIRRGRPLMSMLVTHAQAFRFHAWILDFEAQLWELDLRPDPRYYADQEQRWFRHELVVRDRACRRLCRLGPERIAWVSDSSERVLSIPAFDGEPLTLSEEERELCLLGPQGLLPGNGLCFAYPEGDQLMVQSHGSHSDRVAIPLPEGRPFGLDHGRQSSSRVTVLFVGPDEQGVYGTTDGTEGRLLFTATHPIVAIRHEPVCQKILWCTDRGERGVFDLSQDAVLRRIGSDAEEAER